ncbi:MAG: hypothetical protein BWY72_00704 [Bacteroidetes bacterium ADurb.Bin416]|nr:MAG: hypothetical protein BWY72_00704 [Bacteroidetes bacterium ADurb.Bin416]
MKTVLLKLDDSTYGETESILTRIRKPRNRYINEAVAFYNKYQKRQLIEKQLKDESNLVKEESMRVLNEFESLEYVD